MKRTKQMRAIEQVALNEGVSVEKIRDEIEKVIDIGLASSDENVKKFWNDIPRKNAKPSPEEAIIFLTKKANNIFK